MRIDFAKRARALVGTRFRPQGRTPELGLDCVGLVLFVFEIPGDRFRRDYRLRGDHRCELIGELSKPFRRIPRTQRRAGDVLLLEVARDQLHLGIVTADGFVHADARLGRVVETQGAPTWQILSVFRRRSLKSGQE